MGRIAAIQSAPSLGQMLEETAIGYKSLKAFVEDGAVLAFGEFGKLGADFAAFLQAACQIGKGDRVGLMCPNILPFPVATLGILKAGAIQVNINPMYTASELKHQLNDSGTGTLVMFAACMPAFAKIANETDVKRLVVIQPGDLRGGDRESVPVDLEGIECEVMRFSEALEAGAKADFSPAGVTREDLAFLQYTGGTTGPSKGAMLTHGNVLENILQIHDHNPETFADGEEIIITALPLYHIFGLAVNFFSQAAFGGLNVLIMNPRDLDGFVRQIMDAGMTRINGVNTLYAGLLQHPDIAKVDFSRLKMALGGGTATLKATSDAWERLTGMPILEGYGLSETSPVLASNQFGQTRFTGTVGVALRDTELKVVDEVTGEEVAAGERGELVARGPQVTSGYWNKPEATREAFLPGGFFKTGDIAIMEPDGSVRIVDRRKDMIIVSGFNVYPNDVEQAAASCPGVKECACLGIPDEKSGEAVKLFAVAEPGSGVTAEAIIAHCRERLTGYKVPKEVAFIDEVPKSAVGKMLRRELRGK